MRTAVLAVDICREMVAPAHQRDLHLEHRRAAGSKYQMIVSQVFEAVGRPHRELRIDLPEPEERRIEKMRAKVGQHAGATIAPGRIPDIAGRAVAVEHPAQIDPPQYTRIEHLPHADKVRLEAVIVGRIANGAARSGP